MSSLENEKDERENVGYYLSKVEMKDNNIKINDQNVFDQSINSDTKHM